MSNWSINNLLPELCLHMVPITLRNKYKKPHIIVFWSNAGTGYSHSSGRKRSLRRLCEPTSDGLFYWNILQIKPPLSDWPIQLIFTTLLSHELPTTTYTAFRYNTAEITTGMSILGILVRSKPPLLMNRFSLFLQHIFTCRLPLWIPSFVEIYLKSRLVVANWYCWSGVNPPSLWTDLVHFYISLFSLYYHYEYQVSLKYNKYYGWNGQISVLGSG